MEIVAQIFQICVIPLLGILTKYLIDWLTAQRDQLKAKTDSELAKKYLDMLLDTVRECVITTNQTYVDSLKEQGKFDEAAQKEAFQRTLNAILLVLSDEAKEYLTSITGDLNTYITQLIESQVHYNRTSY